MPRQKCAAAPTGGGVAGALRGRPHTGRRPGQPYRDRGRGTSSSRQPESSRDP